GIVSAVMSPMSMSTIRSSSSVKPDLARPVPPLRIRPRRGRLRARSLIPAGNRPVGTFATWLPRGAVGDQVVDPVLAWKNVLVLVAPWILGHAVLLPIRTVPVVDPRRRGDQRLQPFARGRIAADLDQHHQDLDQRHAVAAPLRLDGGQPPQCLGTHEVFSSVGAACRRHGTPIHTTSSLMAITPMRIESTMPPINTARLRISAGSRTARKRLIAAATSRSYTSATRCSISSSRPDSSPTRIICVASRG